MNHISPGDGDNAKLAAAVEYGKRGLRVLPCNGAKRPLIKGWPEKATTEERQLAAWWEKWPSANIGIATGENSGLLVLDIDVKGDGNGFEELEACLEQPVEDIAAPRYRTPSGGQQLWFRYPKGNDKGIRTKAHIGGLNTDTRANGGFCLAPPSHTETGSYSWIVELEEFDSLPECPADLLELLREPGRPKNSSKSGSQSAIADAEGHSLETHPGAVSGLRNGLLVRLAGKWLVDHPGAEWEKLEPLVLQWNERCRPPKPAEQVLGPSKHLWTKHQRTPKLKLDNLARASQRPAEASSKKKTGKTQLMVRPASAVKPERVEWLWPLHLQLKALNILAGPEGKGKSLMAADFAARVSTGSSWPDGSPGIPGRVLYCSAEEDSASTVVPRLMAAEADLDRIDIVDGLGEPGDDPEEALAIDLGEHLPQVYEQLKQRGDYGLCVWDTFQSVSLQTEHKSNTHQKSIAQPLGRIAAELGHAQLAVEHHARSGLQRGNPDNAILGAGLVRTARAIWHVVEDPDSEGLRLFLPGKLNNANRDAKDLSWQFGFREVPVEIEGRQETIPVIDWLSASGRTLNEVRDEAIGDGKTAGRPGDEYELARDFIRNRLTAPKTSAELKELERFSFRTLQRSAADLGVKKDKPAAGAEQSVSEQIGIPVSELREFNGKAWWWFPPPKLSPLEIPLDGNPSEVSL